MALIQSPISPELQRGHGRVVELDLMRTVAVLLVMGRHWLPGWTGAPAPLTAMLEIWQRGGWMGVDLFFVLSGFLVSGLLFRELEKYGSIRPARFLLRRGLKIYPAFYVFLGVTLPICHRFRPAAVSGQSIVGELLFLQNYLSGVWNHTWSLAVEEHFYLVVPWVLLLLARRPSTMVRNVALLMAVLAVVCLGLRVWWGYTQVDPANHVDTATHYRIDSLMFGVLLSAVFHRHTERFNQVVRTYRWAIVIAGVLLIAPAFVFDPLGNNWLRTYGYTLMYLGGGCWVSLAAVCKLADTRLIRFGAFLGAHSYSIYLWHMPLAWAFSVLGGRILHHSPSAWYFFLFVATAFAVGVAAARVVEFPVLHLRDRFFPSPINPMATPTLRPTHLANAEAT